jgi:hypothetical protein
MKESIYGKKFNSPHESVAEMVMISMEEACHSSSKQRLKKRIITARQCCVSLKCVGIVLFIKKHMAACSDASLLFFIVLCVRNKHSERNKYMYIVHSSYMHTVKKIRQHIDQWKECMFLHSNRETHIHYSRDFLPLVFFKSVSPKPLIIPFRIFEFFRKFAEIFAAQGLPPVSTTPVAIGKYLQAEKF